MKRKKNDFSITFYNGEEKRLFIEFMQDTGKSKKWLKAKGIEWTHAMICNRRTREKVDHIMNPEK